MNTKDLEYYHALVTEKNFSQVAEKFGVTQPTITNAIKRLEKEFQTNFFLRDQSHHNLTVTNNGWQFDQHVSTILSELEIAHKDIANAKEEQILFGLPPIIGNYFFPPLTPALMNYQLMDRLEVFEHGSAQLLKMLRHGDIDIALLGSLIPLNYPRLISRTIQHYPINIIVSKKHHLAKFAQRGIHFRELANEKFINFDEGFVHNQAFRMMCRINHIRPRTIYKTNDVHVLKSMVAENIGISYLTSLAILPSNGLVQIPLLDPEKPEFQISCVRRSTATLTPYKFALWDQLTKPRK
ncbi:LysR family transcriptional regulator [Limosilactobacillus caecicola]|uniref:LysR family transcriptional regulator n=1 Tax=Limosilactobacillus caecicola TaxID=2941332 RepID=UPI00204128D3|nr:LysR family transcriptional regulator [Limosilactobacillus caecicola]